MLYGFLLNADPSACSLAATGRKISQRTREIRSSPPAADVDSSASTQAAARCSTRQLTKVYETIDLPLVGVLYAWRTAAFASIMSSFAHSARAWTRNSRGCPRTFTRSPARRSTSTRRSSSARCCSKRWICPPPKAAKSGRAISTAADVLEDSPRIRHRAGRARISAGRKIQRHLHAPRCPL